MQIKLQIVYLATTENKNNPIQQHGSLTLILLYSGMGI